MRRNPLSIEEAAALLDEVHPWWHEKINTAILDMENASRCILGQLYQHFEKGCKAINLGCCDASSPFGYRASLEKWIDEIHKRRVVKQSQMIQLNDKSQLCYILRENDRAYFHEWGKRVLQSDQPFTAHSGDWYILVPVSADELNRQRNERLDKKAQEEKQQKIAKIKAEQERLAKELKELES